MENLENIFDSEDFGLETPIVELEEPQYIEPDNDDFFSIAEPKNTEETVLDALLKARGITNSKITILDENDQEQEIDFYDLSKEDQLEILSSSEQEVNYDLDESEVDLINHLRSNNLSVNDFLTQFREEILAELQQEVEPSYDIDNYDDQELFLLDLKNKYDLTDDELQAELEKELQNADIFTKKVTKLRSEYKQLEDQYKANQQAEFENQRQEQYNQYANTMANVASTISDFHGVFLEDEEKTETLSYLLDLDDSGSSRFSKDLNDPAKLYEAAWYLRYGKEAFQALENAYETEIARLKKLADKPRAVVQNSGKKITDISQLY